MFHTGWKIATLALAMGLIGGCGKAKQPWERVYPAKGLVSYKGKPLSNAIITLVPVDPSIPASVRPSAISAADGSFQLGTYSRIDGAPVGEFKALVLHYPVVGKKESPSAGPNDLPVKYARAETTDLKLTVTSSQAELATLELK